MQISVTGQTLPVCFKIRVQLTTAEIAVVPAALSFGTCNLAEKTGVQVCLTNRSRLPQQFGELINLPGQPPTEYFQDLNMLLIVQACALAC